jgi:hypothetical protein
MLFHFLRSTKANVVRHYVDNLAVFLEYLLPMVVSAFISVGSLCIVAYADIKNVTITRLHMYVNNRHYSWVIAASSALVRRVV